MGLLSRPVTSMRDAKIFTKLCPSRWGMLVVALAIFVTISSVAHAQSLRGTWQSLDKQNREAKRHDFTYLSDSSQVYRFVDAGLLVALHGNADYELKAVSFPYARPESRLFIERLSAQYRRACGERLVVTSLTRPLSNQPRNASSRSVHPTGMAMDLRRPNGGPCREWLDSTLLYLESRDLIEATLERRPPHYHIAVFPKQYRGYVARIAKMSESQLLAEMADNATYMVRRNDTLWRISKRFDTTPEHLQRTNDLKSSMIYPGQVLKVPAVVNRDR